MGFTILHGAGTAGWMSVLVAWGRGLALRGLLEAPPLAPKAGGPRANGLDQDRDSCRPNFGTPVLVKFGGVQLRKSCCCLPAVLNVVSNLLGASACRPQRVSPF